MDEDRDVLTRPAPGPGAYATNEAIRGRTPVDGVVPVVARLRPDASARLFDASDDVVLAEATPAMRTVLGPGTPEPVWTQVKRWRYCVARERVDQAAVNPEGSRIIIAGDAVASGESVEDVARTGAWAARRLVTG